jgi:hypothetical protein
MLRLGPHRLCARWWVRALRHPIWVATIGLPRRPGLSAGRGSTGTCAGWVGLWARTDVASSASRQAGDTPAVGRGHAAARCRCVGALPITGACCTTGLGSVRRGRWWPCQAGRARCCHRGHPARRRLHDGGRRAGCSWCGAGSPMCCRRRRVMSWPLRWCAATCGRRRVARQCIGPSLVGLCVWPHHAYSPTGDGTLHTAAGSAGRTVVLVDVCSGVSRWHAPSNCRLGVAADASSWIMPDQPTSSGLGRCMLSWHASI